MRSLEPNTCSPSDCFNSSLYLGASGEKRKGERVIRERGGEGEEKGEKEMRVYRREERSKERREERERGRREERERTVATCTYVLLKCPCPTQPLSANSTKITAHQVT